VATPAWSAARSGLLGDTGAVDGSAQINQFLGTHPMTMVYQGNQILTPFGSGGGLIGFTSNQYDLDQPFTMSGTSIGRVSIPMMMTGNACDLVVSLCNDSSGTPGTVITQTKVPANWIQQLSAVKATSFRGVGSPSAAQVAPVYTNNPLAVAQFNRFFMNFAVTTGWPYPTSGTGGPANGPMSTYFGDYFIQLGGTNGGTTFYSDVYTINYDTAGNLFGAIPQPQLPAPHDGSGAVVVSQDPASGSCTLVVTGGSQVFGSITNAVYAASFDPVTGQIGSWSTQSSLPVNMQFHMMAAWNGYIYALAGTQGSNSQGQNVYYAQVTNGQIGAWNTSSLLPLAASNGFSFCAACNGFIFIVGGFNGSTLANVWYAPIHPDGTVGAWLAGPSLPVAAAAVDALPAMIAGNYGLVINAAARQMTLAVSSTGPDIAWQSESVPAGGIFFALASVEAGVWRYYGILGSSYITMDITMMTCLSVPLPATGLTNGNTYHILVQSQNGDLNNYVVLGADTGTVFPGNPHYQYRAKGSATWTASGNGAIPLSIYDQTISGQPWHLWSDSGERVATFVNTTTPDAKPIGLLDATQQPGPVLNPNWDFNQGTNYWGFNNGTLVTSTTFTQGHLPFSGKFTPNGVSTQTYIESGLIAISLQQPYVANCWFYSPTGYSNCNVQINWYSSLGFAGYISSAVGTTTNVAANTWTALTVNGTPPTNAAYATVGVYEHGTPPATAIFYASAVTLQNTLGPMASSVAQFNWPTSWPTQLGLPTGVTVLA
jgi:hypothetical protein